MRRALLVIVPLLLATSASGCWIFLEPDPGCDWFDDCGGSFCDDGDSCGDGGGVWGGGGGSGVVGTVCVPGSTRYCDTPTYCSWGEQVCNDAGDGWSSCSESSPPAGCGGYGYDQDCCMDAGACCQDWYDLDGDGDWLDSVGACEEVHLCTVDSECPAGYCLVGADGTSVCRPSIGCADDGDCAAMGPGFGCDDRGLCAPEESPCPSGGCGCSSDADCGEGLLCVSSRCAQPDSVCFFDFECGEGAACLDNECHALCTDSCPAGQACEGGLCLEPEGGLHGCVYDEDCACPGLACVNATCVPVCAADEDCGEREVCSSGACQPDPAPTRECAADADCAADMACRRGLCRLPCAADVNCHGEMSVCGPDGLCLHPAEVAPSCVRAADCGEGLSCLGNVCR